LTNAVSNLFQKYQIIVQSLTMDVRHALILALMTVPLSACPTIWNCHSDREIFAIDEVITID